MMTKNDEIRLDDLCLEFAGGLTDLGVKEKIVSMNCHNKGAYQKWTYENGLIKHDSGFCMELSQDKVSIFMQECNPSNTHQLWKWKKRDTKLSKS